MARLLLVDDSEAVLAFERSVLGVHHQCTTASDGARALDLLQASVPDLVVLDLTMPVMGGDQVLVRMRSDAALKDVPVVVLSSEAQRATWCREQGAQAFLPKPVDPRTLATTVEDLLGTARLKRMGPIVVGLRVAGLSFLIPVREVQRVVLALPTVTVPGGPAYLQELLTIGSETWPVLDVAQRLGVESAVPHEDRPLVLCHDGEGGRLALRVDQVGDPEAVEVADFTPAESIGVHAGVRVIGVVRSGGVPRVVLPPSSFASVALRRWASGQASQTGEAP